MSIQQAVTARLADNAERFRIGQVSAVAGNKITVVTSGGGSMTIPFLDTWIPTAADIVVIALTPAGWIALGIIA